MKDYNKLSKEQLIDRHAQTLKSWVGTGLAKDECIGLIKNAVDEALFLYGVIDSSVTISKQEYDALKRDSDNLQKVSFSM